MGASCLKLLPSNLSCSPLANTLILILIQLHHKITLSAQHVCFLSIWTHFPCPSLLPLLLQQQSQGAGDFVSRYMHCEGRDRGGTDPAGLPGPYPHLQQRSFIFICFMWRRIQSCNILFGKKTKKKHHNIPTVKTK